MSVVYKGEHEICFWFPDKDAMYERGPFFSWEDYGLIPISRPYISTPKANYTLTQIPNSSTRLNITDFMPGGLTYESRTGEWRFAIDKSHEMWKNWYDGYYKMEELFHGKRVYVSLNDDPENIYKGRVSISSYDPGESYSTITLSYDLDAAPIDDDEKTSVYFRIRELLYNGTVDSTGLAYYGLEPYLFCVGLNDSQLAIYKFIPEGSFFSRWNVLFPLRVTHNIDIYAIYYYRVKPSYSSQSYSTPAATYAPANALSSHPIQYIIEDPEEVTESTYEVPNNVKFLFNNVKYSIDVIGTGGATQKRLWYTPDNMGIETTE